MGKREKKLEARAPRLEPMFETPFRHPVLLSDPGGDFYSETEQRKLRGIVDKSPRDLDWSDFRDIFQVGLPAGNFEECAFYFPWAIAYVRDQRDDAGEFMSNLVWWASDHHDELIAAERLIDRVRDAMKACLEHWTNFFEFEQSAEPTRNAIRFNPPSVKNSGTVCEFIDELCRFRTHADIAVDFLEAISAPTATPIQSAWYLEIVYQFTCGFCRLATKSQLRKRAILTPLGDVARWHHHANVVRATIAKSHPSPDYWEQVLHFT